MPNCPFFYSCKWVKKYSPTNGARTNYYINNYCRGDYLRKCVRKNVAEKIGGREFIPDNMLPDGKPINGTDDSEWSEEVKEIVKSLHEPIHMRH